MTLVHFLVFIFFSVNNLSHLLFNSEILSSFFFHPRVSLQVPHYSLVFKMYPSLKATCNGLMQKKTAVDSWSFQRDLILLGPIII